MSNRTEDSSMIPGAVSMLERGAHQSKAGREPDGSGRRAHGLLECIPCGEREHLWRECP